MHSCICTRCDINCSHALSARDFRGWTPTVQLDVATDDPVRVPSTGKRSIPLRCWRGSLSNSSADRTLGPRPARRLGYAGTRFQTHMQPRPEVVRSPAARGRPRGGFQWNSLNAEGKTRREALWTTIGQ